MDDANDDAAPYAVGYGKPPVHTRFKPGQSGNPSGVARNAKPVSLREAFLRAAVARADVPGVRAGSFDCSLMEALMMELFRKGIAGDQRAAKLLLELGREHLPRPQSDDPP